MTTSPTSRLGRLAEAMQRDGLDAYFCASPVSMGYLHGFWEGGGERFLTLAVRADGTTRMICPGLSETQAKRCGMPDVRSWRDGEDPLELFSQLAQDWGLKAAMIGVDDDMSAGMLLSMQNRLPGALFRHGHPTLSSVMSRKTQDELDCMLQAGAIADRAFEQFLPKLRVGMTEVEAANLILQTMQDLGGQPAFCIVAAGANGAEPHHHNDQTPIAQNDVVILDFGCKIQGYNSDITRTVCFGKATDEQRGVYEVVYKAFMAGRNVIKPGLAGQEVDRAARKVIVDAELGPYFMHRTGHGIGIQGHEAPFMVEGNTAPLEIGNCFSVEPGVYLQGRFGVRIENCVAVTADGHMSLNAEPSPTLIELG